MELGMHARSGVGGLPFCFKRSYSEVFFCINSPTDLHRYHMVTCSSSTETVLWCR
jgi:hypothetical protein